MDILKEISSGIQYYLIFHTAIISVLKKMGKCIYEYRHVYKISLEGITKIFHSCCFWRKEPNGWGQDRIFIVYFFVLFEFCATCLTKSY